LLLLKRIFYKLNKVRVLFGANLKKKIVNLNSTFSLASDLTFQNLSKVWKLLLQRRRWVTSSKSLTRRLKTNELGRSTSEVFLYFLTNLDFSGKVLTTYDHFLTRSWKNWSIIIGTVWKSTFGDGFLYLRGLFIIFFIDALITDDEPLWEPVEWSLVQSWIMFIFLFAWIAENLISSRYGSYTGRDKRVWFSWYKTFWLIEGWYILSLGLASLWVMVPHYYEVTYSISFIHSWWHWYSRVFFFKFLSIYTIVLFLAYYLQITMRWVNWKKPFVLVLCVNFFLSYLIYSHFFFSFFGYFTDANWCRKTRLVDYVQLSHEPFKWSWGPASRDHFIYHQSKTVFWFKSDGPFAGAFLFYNIFFFLALFTLLIYWVSLARRIYATQEVTFTFTTYCISALKQFFYFFSLMFLLVTLSFFFTYWRLPIEFYWSLNSHSWLYNFMLIISDYPLFLLSIFK
jgi:hypothetical protein